MTVSITSGSVGPAGANTAAAAPGAADAAGPVRPGRRRFRFDLASYPESAAQARRLTRDRLDGWGLGADTRDAAELVVSELVTNAVLHTLSGRIVCELHEEAGKLRIAVRDEGCPAGAPQPSPRLPAEEHGRGLLLVSAVCSAWGSQETGPGLLVWAELPRDAELPSPEGELPTDTRAGARPEAARPAQAPARVPEVEPVWA